MDIPAILQRFAAGSVTEAERAEFADYIKTLSPIELEALMIDYERVMEVYDMQQVDAREAISERVSAHRSDDLPADPELLKHIGTAIGHLERLEWNGEPGRYRKRRGKVWRMVFIPAACLILVAAIYLLGKPKTIETPKVRAGVASIGPGGNRATLTLANGNSVVLDSVAIGQQNAQGDGLTKLADGELVRLEDGKLQYGAEKNGAAGSNPEETRFNTLTTPRGGQYQVVLSDGTKVWLNAASAIRYPTVFKGKDREVEVRGEAYFEVAQDMTHPFKVSVAQMSVEVLGTSFNIKDYTNEADSQVHTTLVQGAVRVLAGKSSAVLRPGQQANVGIGNQQLGVKSGVDVESVTAWVNGKLVLNGADIRELMEEISRWFDVNIRYEGRAPSIGHGGFFGFIDRNVPLTNLLEVLDSYGVKTRVEGRTIIVQ